MAIRILGHLDGLSPLDRVAVDDQLDVLQRRYAAEHYDASSDGDAMIVEIVDSDEHNFDGWVRDLGGVVSATPEHARIWLIVRADQRQREIWRLGAPKPRSEVIGRLGAMLSDLSQVER